MLLITFYGSGGADISQFNHVCYIAATSLSKQCLMESMKLGLKRLMLLMCKYLKKGLMKTWHISENQNTIVKNAGHRKWWALMWFWWSTAEVWREAAVYLSAMDLTRGNLSSSIYNWPPPLIQHCQPQIKVVADRFLHFRKVKKNYLLIGLSDIGE